MCNFGLEKNGMPLKINRIILQGQGQEKKSPEENLLLSPVKKTGERYCCYPKLLKHDCEVRSLREERHISLRKVET